ncbi:hypothetical protein ACQYRI_09590 [Salmonella enterica]
MGGNWYFSWPGEDVSYWYWAGYHRGTYSDPKSWSEYSYPGAIHRGEAGLFESKFSGKAGSTWYYPAADKNNAHWFWRGVHAGTRKDPKLWSEISYPGAIHYGGNNGARFGYFESRFNGQPGASWYFSWPGEDDPHWYWRGYHAGTFSDPKYWGEITNVGALHYQPRNENDNEGYWEARFDGSASDNSWWYPSSGSDNAHWNWLFY